MEGQLTGGLINAPIASKNQLNNTCARRAERARTTSSLERTSWEIAIYMHAISILIVSRGNYTQTGLGGIYLQQFTKSKVIISAGVLAAVVEL
jgi:hypothetical protein